MANSSSSSVSDADKGEHLNFLFISSDTFPPFRVDVSILFGEEFRQRGHKIDWVLQSEQPLKKTSTISWGDWLVHLGATNSGQSLVARLRKHIDGVANDLKILKLARVNQYDFIQVKDKFLAALIAIYAAKKSKTAFTYWLSYPFPEASIYEATVGTARYPFLYRIRGAFFSLILYRFVLRHASQIFVQSNQMKLDMIAKGADPDLLTVVPMGFASETTTPPKRHIIRHQMIYVGTLLQTRKLDFLVRVLKKVRNQISDARLLMVGPEELPGDAQLLKDVAKELRLECSLELTGKLDRSAALEHVSQSGVCVSPFYPTPILNSTSPTKLVEYFSMARPAVANDHPEQKLVINESGGGHCVAYDEDEFAAAVIDLMSRPREADAMGEAAFRYVQAHRSYRSIADSVEKKYRELFL